MSTDNLAYKHPVSIKGILIIDGKVPLLKNERNEYELPGGKLDPQEQPVDCVVREIKEELNLSTSAVDIVDSWLYVIKPDICVVIITYGCILTEKSQRLIISSEHKDFIMASPKELEKINMPEGYKHSIKKWFTKNIF